MNMKQTIGTGLLTVIAFSTLTFMPASATTEPKTASTGTEVVVALNATETPQSQVWDMTYGDSMPSVSAADEPVVAPVNNDNVQDLSLG